MSDKEDIFNNGKFDPWGKACVDFSERQLIEGPRTVLADLKRLLKITFEFVRGFHSFRNLEPCVTFFGSARFNQHHPYYKLAQQTSKLISQAGFTIMTGGGPGIMEAANRGARDVNGPSVGCNITLPTEQEPNPYLDKFVEIDHFYVRKVMLLRYSYAFVAMPGGFGTLDEVFETITLMQTQKIGDFPIVIMGQDFWQPVRDLIEDQLLKYKTIAPSDLKLTRFTDDPEEALKWILTFAETNLGYRRAMRPKP